MSDNEQLYYTCSCGCKFRQKSEIIKAYDGLPPIEIDWYNLPFGCTATWDLLGSGRTRGIFQLESNLGRGYSRKLEPEVVDHLAALFAALRPGTMNTNLDGKSMTNWFVDRKQKVEGISYYEPRMEQYLEDTFGVMLYQEQLTAIAKGIAGYDALQAKKLLKSVAKKKVDQLLALEGSFIQGCINNGLSRENAVHIFEDFKSSGRYLFNKCISPDTLCELEDGTIKTVDDLKIGDRITCPDLHNNSKITTVVNKYENGNKYVVNVKFYSGKEITCSVNHKFLASDFLVRPLYEIISEGLYIVNHERAFEKIWKLETCGQQRVVDIEVDNYSHLFFANGIATSNSHAYSYAYIGYITAYLKTHFPIHFFTTYLKHVKDDDELKELLSELSLFNIEIKTPSASNPSARFTIKNGYIQYGMGELKKVGLKSAQEFGDKITEVEKEVGKSISEFSWYEFLILLSQKTDTRSVYNILACGFMDGSGVSRTRQLAEHKAFCDLTGKPELDFVQRRWKEFDNLTSLIQAMLDESIQKLVNKKREEYETVYTVKGQRRGKVESILSSLVNPASTFLDTTKWVCDVETELMGTAISRSKTAHLERLGNLKCLDFALGKGYTNLNIVCEVISIDERVIKTGKNAGKKFANIKLKDTSGEIECTIFSKEWDELRGDVIVGNVLMVKGRRNQDKTLKIDEVKIL